MPTFFTDITIEKGTEKEYNDVSNMLVSLGFSKQIQAKDGIIYRLPMGLHSIDNSSDKETVRNLASSALQALSKRWTVFVIESVDKGACWGGFVPPY